MTTAFTAIPAKMTMSLMRFLSPGMDGIYQAPAAAVIDPNQARRSQVEVKYG
ncbi:MAG: hypothetical protein GY948_12970 [Alphaproteobacteria bacterium]|nr:hypothetical protein [Alphaproteobacteria bacterium]